MKFETEKVGNILIVKLLSEVLDINNARTFKTDIRNILEDNKKVVFDLNLVKFIDSSGCGILLSCLRELNDSGGDLKFYGVQKQVRTLFELIRMNRIVDILDTKEEAVNAFLNG